LGLFVFQQVAQAFAHGHAPFTLQAHHPGILARDVNEGEQVACVTIVWDESRVMHFHQIGLIDGEADHRLATGKALALQTMQGEVGFAMQIGLSGFLRHAQRSGGTQQFFRIAAQGIRTVLSKNNRSKVLFPFFMITLTKKKPLQVNRQLYLFVFSPFPPKKNRTHTGRLGFGVLRGWARSLPQG